MKLKAMIVTAAVITAAGGSVYAAELVSSPDDSIKAELSFDGGHISYTAEKNGVAVLAPSPLGIRFEDADFTENISFVSREDHYIDERYEAVSGKTRQHINKANESVFTLWKDGRELKLYVRAYNDGVAIRYGYDSATLAYGEATAYNFAGGDHKVWAQIHEHAYENYYKPNTLMSLTDSYGMPLTIQINDSLYAMVTEAELNGSYAGAVLKADGKGSLKIEYEKTQKGAVEISQGFLSPWRVTVIGTLSYIAQTYLPENLCKPSQLSDCSWIKPGVSGWTWFNGDPTNDPEVYKQYIDFSAEMGWDYVLLDEGWQPLDHEIDSKKSYSGIQSWTKDIIDYAASKNIGIFVWSTSWDLDTPEKRARLREWAEMGIKGVKVDFFDSESQQTLRLYDAITEETAQLRLMVNYHG